MDGQLFSPRVVIRLWENLAHGAQTEQISMSDKQFEADFHIK